MRLLTLRVVDDVIGQLAKWRAQRSDAARRGQRQRARPAHRRDGRPARRAARPATASRRSSVQLEITEGALMADPRRVLVTLHRLDKLGVALVAGRLRHRLLVDAAPAPAAAGRGQDRPVVRARHGRRPRRRRDRPLDDRPGPRAGAAGGRRGRRGRPYLAAAARCRLPRRPGLVSTPGRCPPTNLRRGSRATGRRSRSRGRQPLVPATTTSPNRKRTATAGGR